jgi:hypothetical protein
VAFCADNGDASSSTQATYDLLAGPLPADGGPPLPRVATAIVLTAQDPDPTVATKFQYDLTPDGGYFAWSARPTATGVETLNLKRLGDATPAQVVAADVASWRVSTDGTRWYWLRSYNYDAASPSGTLQAAPFPGGAGPTTLAAGVGYFSYAGDHDLAFLDGYAQGAGTFKVVSESAAGTAAVTTIDTGVYGWLDVSPDGTQLLYAKTIHADNTTDLWLGSTAAAPCLLSSAGIGLQIPSFLSSTDAAGGGLTWARYEASTGEWQGMFTKGAGCASTQFASNVVSWVPIGAEGYTYVDDSPDQVYGTLRYIQALGGVLSRTPAIQTHAEPAYAPLMPALPAVLYVVSGVDTTQDGLYLSGGLPVSAGATPRF